MSGCVFVFFMLIHFSLALVQCMKVHSKKMSQSEWGENYINKLRQHTWTWKSCLPIIQICVYENVSKFQMTIRISLLLVDHSKYICPTRH